MVKALAFGKPLVNKRWRFLRHAQMMALAKCLNKKEQLYIQVCKLLFFIQSLVSALSHIAPLPDRRCEQHQDRENFQSAQQHDQTKKQFGER